jgi:hypothetical protein
MEASTTQQALPCATGITIKKVDTVLYADMYSTFNHYVLLSCVGVADEHKFRIQIFNFALLIESLINTMNHPPKPNIEVRVSVPSYDRR